MFESASRPVIIISFQWNIRKIIICNIDRNGSGWFLTFWASVYIFLAHKMALELFNLYNTQGVFS